MKSIIFNLVQALLEAVYPPVCCVCDSPFKSPAMPLLSAGKAVRDGMSDGRTFPELMSEHACPECAAAFVPVVSPLCLTCGAMFKSRSTLDHVCGDCRRVPKFFRSARAAGLYEQSLMTAIQRLKYSGRTELAEPLGKLLLKVFFIWYDLTAVDMVVPVPLHPRKQRQRGFNQTYLLIRQWRKTKTVDQAGFPREKIHRDILVRTRPTKSQTTLSREARLENVRGAFALSDPVRVRGRSILLVDDVYTTGATVNECARVLMAGGAAGVDILTMARVR